MKSAETQGKVWPGVRMEYWCEGDQSSPRCRGDWWGSAVIVWLILSVGYVPALYGRPASAAHQRVAQQVAPSTSPPPALPVSATERVLALSLEDAIRLALQNKLDVEGGRLDPQVMHTQVQRAGAAFALSVGLITRLTQPKTLTKHDTT